MINDLVVLVSANVLVLLWLLAISIKSHLTIDYKDLRSLRVSDINFKKQVKNLKHRVEYHEKEKEQLSNKVESSIAYAKEIEKHYIGHNPTAQGTYLYPPREPVYMQDRNAEPPMITRIDRPQDMYRRLCLNITLDEDFILFNRYNWLESQVGSVISKVMGFIQEHRSKGDFETRAHEWNQKQYPDNHWMSQQEQIETRNYER